MAVNSTDSCISKSGSNCSSDRYFECMDSYPGNLLTAVIIMINVIIFLPVNCWILWLVRTNKGSVWTDIVILNQSIAEVIGGISLCTFIFGAIFNKKSLSLISNFLCSSFLVGRPLFQTYFCIERYLAVVHPLIYLKYMKDPKGKVSLVALFWLVVVLFGWYFMVFFPNIAMWSYMGLILGILVVCTFCSLMILWVLKRPKPGDGEKEGSYQLKRKAFTAVTVILVMLLIGYGPVSCIIVLKNLLPYHLYCLLLGASWWSLLPVGALQPYLYLSKVNRLPCIKNV